MSRSITGCYRVGSPEAAELIGCGGVGCVVGAEALGEAAGVWMKVRFYREGSFLCATVYSVAAGEPRVVDLRVDLRPIARALMKLHAEMHAKDSLRGASVGWSLGSMWKGVKKTAKAIGRSKLVKGVVAVSKGVYAAGKAVVKSKITGALLSAASVFPLTAPFAAPALGAYAAANTAVKAVNAGAKVVKVASQAASTISQGVHLAKTISARKVTTAAAVSSAGAAMTPAQRAAVAARVKSAASAKLSATGKLKLAGAFARLPTTARPAAAAVVKRQLGTLAQVKAAGALAQALPTAAKAQVLATTRLEVQAAPVLAKAAATAKTLRDPAVRTKLAAIRTQAEKAKTALEGIQQRASTATGAAKLDAQKSAVIVNLVARNQARIQAMSQASAGGLPGVLITPEGKLVKGRFRVQASANAGGLLYQGKGKTRERGAFARVSGVSPGLFGADALESGEFARLSSIAVNGDLPIDGVRVQAAGANSRGIGPYERVSGCGGGCGCASCGG